MYVMNPLQILEHSPHPSRFHRITGISNFILSLIPYNPQRKRRNFLCRLRFSEALHRRRHSRTARIIREQVVQHLLEHGAAEISVEDHLCRPRCLHGARVLLLMVLRRTDTE